MKKIVWPLLIFALTSSTLKAQPGKSPDELIANITNAFNNHDAAAFATCFTTDADFTNVIGRQAHGRDSIAIFHQPLFAPAPVPGSPWFYKSTLSVKKKTIRLLSPSIAEVDVWWEQTASTGPDGKPWPPRKGLINTVAVNAGGQWLFEVFHNMDIGQFNPAK